MTQDLVELPIQAMRAGGYSLWIENTAKARGPRGPINIRPHILAIRPNIRRIPTILLCRILLFR